MADSTSLAFSVLRFPFIAKLLAQDVAYSTKTLAAREMALRASLEMLTPSGSCEKSEGEQSYRPSTCFPLPARPPLVRPPAGAAYRLLDDSGDDGIGQV